MIRSLFPTKGGKSTSLQTRLSQVSGRPSTKKVQTAEQHADKKDDSNSQTRVLDQVRKTYLTTRGKPCSGRIKYFSKNWEKPLKSFQIHTPHTRLYGCHSVAMDDQVKDHLNRGIIIPCCNEGEFVSTVFLREKKKKTFCMILKLKELNQFIPYHHFKMDSIHRCIRLMTPLCYMASIDLQDTYFSIPVHEDYQKYLKFCWKGILYKFACMPQGIACAPRLFTKLMKPVYSSVRSKGLVSSGYLDDSLLVETPRICV